MKKYLHSLLIIPVLFVCMVTIECSSKSSGNASYSIALSFTRIESPGLDPFRVTITLTKEGSPLPGATLDIAVEKPSSNANISISAVTDKGNGTYEFTVTPDQTGEYPVTVAYDGVSVTRTPLVMEYVHPEWDQPMSVPGLVNTEGYEDGVTITPDGEYLFVQTGPYRFSSIFVYNEPRVNGGCGGDRLNPSRCEHPWINETCGTYTAPERPGFFNGRFSGTTQLHNANSWGVGIDQAPNYAISTMFYGFKRQSDGTFTKPFYMV
ncbi:MAG TPA: FixH family protein [Spirochaetota bacterium]|nr:FixH family protein [Spirochaetota bacterium]HOM09599.1 FixH family protein [Spirochaetota bacterium]